MEEEIGFIDKLENKPLELDSQIQGKYSLQIGSLDWITAWSHFPQDIQPGVGCLDLEELELKSLDGGRSSDHHNLILIVVEQTVRSRSVPGSRRRLQHLAPNVGRDEFDGHKSHKYEN